VISAGNTCALVIGGGTPVATARGVNFDAPQPSGSPNDTPLHIEGLDDTQSVDPDGIDAFESETPDTGSNSSADPATPAAGDPPEWSAHPAVRALAALVLLQALVIGGLLFARTNAFQTHTGRLVVESTPPGADVWLDGRHLGLTPLSLMSDAGVRALRIDARGSSQTMKVDVTTGQVTHARIDFVGVAAEGAAAPIPSVTRAVPAAPAPQVTHAQPPVPVRAKGSERALAPGWIDVPAVVALDVYEDGRHLGNTGDGRLLLPAGQHALEFVNEDLGVRVRAAARVQPGKVTSVLVRRADLAERRVQADFAADGSTPSIALTE
jgi:hypothetical protein